MQELKHYINAFSSLHTAKVRGSKGETRLMWKMNRKKNKEGSKELRRQKVYTQAFCSV